MSDYTDLQAPPTSANEDQYAGESPATLAGQIQADAPSNRLDWAPLVVSRQPGEAIADKLRSLDQDRLRYEDMRPRGADADVDLPEIAAWLEADEAMNDARDRAHAGAQRIRAAIAADDLAAYNATVAGKKIPAPTVGAVEVAAVEDVRSYGALLAIAAERIGDVRDALAVAWGGWWRAELVERIAVAKAHAITAVGVYMGALDALLTARKALVAADQRYGQPDYPGQPMPLNLPADSPGWLNPPPWSDTLVAQILRGEGIGSMNRKALNPPSDMRDAEAFIYSELVNVEFTPGAEQVDPDPPTAA